MTAAKSHTHGFFAIDSRIWAKVTACGMNEAVAYLVLACGTGHDNRSTLWSITATMKYVGVGWIRAKPAIEQLLADGFIRYAGSSTRTNPCYELATYRELVAHEAEKARLAPHDYIEQRELSNIREGKQPKHHTCRNVADRLVDRGLLLRDAKGNYMLPESATEASENDLIWLPNALVMGTSNGEESPVRKVRSAGCIWTLRLFVDLYSAQNLRDDGGISPAIIKEEFERLKVGEQGAFTVWGFKSKGLSGQWAGPIAAHRSRQKRNPKDDEPLWDSVRLLQSMGLLSFVPHIFENDTNIAEPIHVYGIGGVAEPPIEKEIGDAANRAARAMALPFKLEETIEEGFKYFCPVIYSRPFAQMIGVARLTYRPNTKRTSEWFAELHQSAPVWIETFIKLVAKGEEAAFHRAANYA